MPTASVRRTLDIDTSFPADTPGWSGCLPTRLSGLGEGVEDGGGGRGGMGLSGWMPGGDVASAERGQGADGDRCLA
jgi:hypothetical protein